ncbi:hypothetical protein GA0115251_106932 [Streptomyces sp. TverLS-915]|uniref:hypothetical protein n=1 Tax=Streptomyces sp. TverLS-915 TaxID=1839763 RepID=UPI00081EE8C6|nr:hypothetical protein [Streptomyces sp. TverLS-915]SCD41086.1 hypothetical protein GA0115251_106932 [Streptomyces sp. TverLS-915]
MGWSSANRIFDPIARALQDAHVPAESRRKILGDLIDGLQDGDWDTEDESLEGFLDDPAVVLAFADHGVHLSDRRCCRASLADDPRAQLLSMRSDEVDEAEMVRALDAFVGAPYRERAHLLALLAAMTSGAVLAPAPDVDEPGWQILFLTIGDQQCSWHIAPADIDLFAFVEHVPAIDPRAQWNGHTTDEKYERIAEHTAELAQHCGPECAEMHTETGRCEIARNR